MPRARCRLTKDDVLTITELAAYLKLSKSTLYKLAQEGKVPGQKVGKHWRFRRESIDRWRDAGHMSCPPATLGVNSEH